MVTLERDSYYKVINPLRQVKINHLFARSVVEKHISGKVFVDNPANPRTFYVIHPYGMSLLFGDWTNTEFNRAFLDYALNIHKKRDKHEWMQAYPSNWDKVLSGLFGDSMITSAENKEHKETGIIECNTRINFTFNRATYLENRSKKAPQDAKIVRSDKHIFEAMKGSVIPFYFYDSVTDFIKNGIGFSVICKDIIASTAYSAFIHDDQLELGIETMPEFRGRGFAQWACSALIDYCLNNDYEPVWACRLENTGSYRLAQKLGFEACAEIPYNRLSK